MITQQDINTLLNAPPVRAVVAPEDPVLLRLVERFPFINDFFEEAVHTGHATDKLLGNYHVGNEHAVESLGMFAVIANVAVQSLSLLQFVAAKALTKFYGIDRPMKKMDAFRGAMALSAVVLSIFMVALPKAALVLGAVGAARGLFYVIADLVHFTKERDMALAMVKKLKTEYIALRDDMANTKQAVLERLNGRQIAELPNDEQAAIESFCTNLESMRKRQQKVLNAGRKYQENIIAYDAHFNRNLAMKFLFLSMAIAGVAAVGLFIAGLTAFAFPLVAAITVVSLSVLVVTKIALPLKQKFFPKAVLPSTVDPDLDNHVVGNSTRDAAQQMFGPQAGEQLQAQLVRDQTLDREDRLITSHLENQNADALRELAVRWAGKVDPAQLVDVSCILQGLSNAPKALELIVQSFASREASAEEIAVLRPLAPVLAPFGVVFVPQMPQLTTDAPVVHALDVHLPVQTGGDVIRTIRQHDTAGVRHLFLDLASQACDKQLSYSALKKTMDGMPNVGSLMQLFLEDCAKNPLTVAEVQTLSYAPVRHILQEHGVKFVCVPAIEAGKREGDRLQHEDKDAQTLHR